MLSRRATEALRLMRDTGEELVAEGLVVWIGEERFSARTRLALLEAMAISDVSHTSDRSFRRYIVNSTGRAILERPELADEIKIALAKGEPFTIRDNRVALI